MFCDEAQRYDDNEYEWLRDVHEHLDRLKIKLFTILVDQQDLLSIKIALQCAGKTQSVARLMVDELGFHGIGFNRPGGSSDYRARFFKSGKLHPWRTSFDSSNLL